MDKNTCAKIYQKVHAPSPEQGIQIFTHLVLLESSSRFNLPSQIWEESPVREENLWSRKTRAHTSHVTVLYAKLYENPM